MLFLESVCESNFCPLVPVVLTSDQGNPITTAHVQMASSIVLEQPVLTALRMRYSGIDFIANIPGHPLGTYSNVVYKNRVVAVIQYRHRGSLNWEHFRQACINETDQKLGLIDRKVRDAKHDKEICLPQLRGSAKSSAIQACLHRVKSEARHESRVKHVAVFDWDRLFLWKLPAPGESLNANTGHSPWAYGTWVGRRDEIRSALLGFIIDAIEDHKALSFRSVPGKIRSRL